MPPDSTPDPSPAAASISEAASAIITLDQLCLCSYNLRGLPITGACPECNRQVADSLPTFPLIATTREYRAALVRGLGLVFAGVALALLFITTGIVLTATGVDPPEWVGFVGFLLPQAAIIVGYWLYTAPDPLFGRGTGPVLSRRVLRIASISAVAWLTTGSAVGAFFYLVPPVFEPLADVVTVFSPFAALAAFAVHFFAMMHFTRWTLLRLPHHAWARRIGRYTWLIPVLVAVPFPLLFLIAFMVLSIADSRQSTVMTTLFIVSCGVLGFILLGAILFTHMLFAVRRCLQRLDDPRT